MNKPTQKTLPRIPSLNLLKISILNNFNLKSRETDFFIQKEQQKTYGLGTIKFSLSYDFGSQTLLVKIVKADNIPAMDIGGTSDPFVKVS